MIRSVEVVDTFERDGRILLLLPDRLIEPSTLARLIVSLCADGIAMDDLVSAVVDVVGAPESGTAADHVATWVADLRDVGLLMMDEEAP